MSVTSNDAHTYLCDASDHFDTKPVYYYIQCNTIVYWAGQGTIVPTQFQKFVSDLQLESCFYLADMIPCFMQTIELISCQAALNPS